MCLDKNIVPEANRLDAIAYAFESKYQPSAQVAILLNFFPLFGKVCTYANNLFDRFSELPGLHHDIYARCSNASVIALTRHVRATDTQPSKPTRKYFMKIVGDKALSLNAVCKEKMA